VILTHGRLVPVILRCKNKAWHEQAACPDRVNLRRSWRPDQRAFWGLLHLHELTLRAMRLRSFVLSARNGVTAVHIGQHVPDNLDTAEKQLRPTASPPAFGFVILVEGIGVAELEAARPDVVKLATRSYSGSMDFGVFRLAYLLD
jgi:hypothetical protein